MSKDKETTKKIVIDLIEMYGFDAVVQAVKELKEEMNKDTEAVYRCKYCKLIGSESEIKEHIEQCLYNPVVSHTCATCNHCSKRAMYLGDNPPKYIEATYFCTKDACKACVDENGFGSVSINSGKQVQTDTTCDHWRKNLVKGDLL